MIRQNSDQEPIEALARRFSGHSEFQSVGRRLSMLAGRFAALLDALLSNRPTAHC